MGEGTGYFFRHLIFSAPEHRSGVESMLALHIHNVARFFGETGQTGSLYISGSLARGEPSLEFRGGEAVKLRSDIDWVIVDDTHLSGVDRNFEKALEGRFTGFLDTVYRLPADRIEVLRSASTRDLRLGLRRPIVDRGVCVAHPAFPLRPIHGLEVIVYYIIAAMELVSADGRRAAAAGMWARQWPAAGAKLAVETLRMASIASSSGPCPGTYAAAFEDARGGLTEDLLSFPEAESLLRFRERGEASERPAAINLGRLVLRTIARIFDIPAATPQDLLSFLRHSLLSTGHILHRFPLLALGALFTRDGLLELPVLKKLFHADVDFQDPVSRVEEYRWAYIRALLAAKDRGIQLDALA